MEPRPAPRLRIAPGDTVSLECVDASGAQVRPGMTVAEYAGIDRKRIHALTGPIHVEGTQVGDGLQVDVLQVAHKGGDTTKGPHSAMQPDALDTVNRVTNRLWPGVPVVPTMVMGPTDGRSLRAAGIPTYGIQGFFFDRNDIRFHGRNERMAVQSLYQGQTFLCQLVKILSGAAD